jgi:DNA-binding transcriptional ArsR family regulator
MKPSRAVTALAGLAHKNRLAVFRMLVAAGPEGRSAGAIAARLKLPPSSLTFHLQHLQRAGLLTCERRSRQLIYAADFAVMNALVDYLTENCCEGSRATCDLLCAPSATSRPAPRRRNVA